MAGASSALSVRIGRWLFRWRGLTPVPFIGAALWLAVDDLRHGPAPSAVMRLGMGLGIALCVLGQLLRGWVRGVVTTDSSNQGRILAAGVLNTAGAYRFTRNPLYLGNFLLVAGLLAQVPDLRVWALGLGFFFGEYHFIIRAEEDFLLGRFGADYERLLATVPRFWPRLVPAPASASPGRFDARRALWTEHNTAAAWIAGLISVAGLRAEAGAPFPALAPVLPAFGGLVLVGTIYVAVKGWKRGWWSGLRRRSA